MPISENTTSAADAFEFASPQSDFAHNFVSAVREPRASVTVIKVLDASPGTTNSSCPPEYLNANSRSLLQVDDATS